MAHEHQQPAQRSQVHKRYDAAFDPIRLERERPTAVDAAPHRGVGGTAPRSTSNPVWQAHVSVAVDFSTEAVSHYKGMTDSGNEWKH